MAFDIEHFPTSPSAIRMMDTLTKNGWYDNSYVAKWIFQVMGLEMDDARAKIEGMEAEAFPETCTWSIPYWEEKFSLPIREDLPLEERRRRVLYRRGTRKSLSPYRMEQVVEDYTGQKITIRDINDGEEVSHPNVFRIYIPDTTTSDLGKIIDVIKSMKQSHTTFETVIASNIDLIIYVHPRPWLVVSPVAGEQPDTISTGASIGRPHVEVQVHPEEFRVQPSFNDDPYANDGPFTGTEAVPSRADIELQTRPVAFKVAPPEANEVDTGEYPETSAQGITHGITMGISDRVFVVDVPYCGEDS